MTEADVASVAAMMIEEDSRGSSVWDESTLRDELSRSWAHLWAIRSEEKEALAFIATWLVQDELHILNIATRESHRRKGHASALLRHALEFANAHAVRLVLLEVRRSNRPAIELYRRIGFAAVAIRARYYNDNEDAVEMRLQLDPTNGAIVAFADEVKL
ncbi:MAG: hypothetical protein NVSMB1_01700 [Polyangiales bacterium]